MAKAIGQLEILDYAATLWGLPCESHTYNDYCYTC